MWNNNTTVNGNVSGSIARPVLAMTLSIALGSKNVDQAVIEAAVLYYEVNGQAAYNIKVASIQKRGIKGVDKVAAAFSL